VRRVVNSSSKIWALTRYRTLVGKRHHYRRAYRNRKDVYDRGVTSHTTFVLIDDEATLDNLVTEYLQMQALTAPQPAEPSTAGEIGTTKAKTQDLPNSSIRQMVRLVKSEPLAQHKSSKIEVSLVPAQR